MRLTGLFILSISPCLFASGASAEVPEPCLESSIRNLCPASCAVACRDTAFLTENATYCLNNGHFVGDANVEPAGDARDCVQHFGTAGTADAPDRPQPDPDGPRAPADTEAVQPEGSNCDALPTLSERRRCALAEVTPACSANVTELEGQARLLVTEIELELAQYGDLLTLDWTDVNNRELLCAFTLDELDENYEIASENPQILRELQRTAGGIQECQRDWEDWVRSNAGSESSDRLIDNVTRESEQKLEALGEQMRALSVSVARLQSAADTIVEIVDIHLIFCDPTGSPPLTQ